MIRADNAAGFTLLELLVAMTVLATLSAVVATGMSFGTRVWESQKNELTQGAELHTVQNVIHRTLGEAWPLRASGSAADTQNVAFTGGKASVEFVGPPPALSVVGGIYEYGLFTRSEGGGSRLILTWRLRNPVAKPRSNQRGEPGAARGRSGRSGDRATSSFTGLPSATARRAGRARGRAAEETREIVLLDRLESAEFAYFGATGDEKPRWREIWQDNPKLPLLVRIRVIFPPGDPRRWPEMVIAPAITTLTGES